MHIICPTFMSKINNLIIYLLTKNIYICYVIRFSGWNKLSFHSHLNIFNKLCCGPYWPEGKEYSIL